jgi:hypothetical protein
LGTVLGAAKVLDGELEAMLGSASLGLRAAISGPTEMEYAARVRALDARLALT